MSEKGWMHNDRGAALLLAIILVTTLAAVGAAVALTARTETLIAGSFQHGREALYAAEGGITLAIHDLASLPDWTSALSGTPSSFIDGQAAGPKQLPGGDTIALCCGPGSLTAEVEARAAPGGEWGSDSPVWRMFAWGPASGWLPPGAVESRFYVVVWVADDARDGDGDPAADSNGVLWLHGVALGPGGARRSVQAAVQRRGAGGPPPASPVRLMSWHAIRW